MDPDPLALEPERMREMGYAVIDMLVARIEALRDGPVLRTDTRDAMRDRLAAPASEAAGDFDDLLRRLDEDVLPYVGHFDHPRFFGYIPGAGTWPAALGDFLQQAHTGDYVAIQAYLTPTAETEDKLQRLRALVDSDDGFELAEIDLDIRGEGTIMGERQKGRNDLKLASLRRDREWVVRAREAASELVDEDPDLSRHPQLLAEIDAFLDDEDREYLLKG